MGKREKFKEIIIETEDSPQKNMKLTYYLLTENVREEYCDLKVYGAEIDKENIFGGEFENESKVIKNLFFRRQEAESFLEKLSRNQVTPMGLKSAVTEHIGEQIKILTCEG